MPSLASSTAPLASGRKSLMNVRDRSGLFQDDSLADFSAALSYQNPVGRGLGISNSGSTTHLGNGASAAPLPGRRSNAGPVTGGRRI